MKLAVLSAVAGLALAAAAPSPVQAASVAYLDGHNVWLSSPDGAHKVALTTDGTADSEWRWPAQGPDGKTVAVRYEPMPDGGQRPVLYLFGPDGKRLAMDLLPRAPGLVSPKVVSIAIDAHSNWVAFGYLGYDIGAQAASMGYWLTTATHAWFPANPVGQQDALYPTFFGTRIVSVDHGSVFVQPDVPEAPQVSSDLPWLSVPGWNFRRVSVAPNGGLVAMELSHDGEPGNYVFVGRPEGAIPSPIAQWCALPTGDNPDDVSFSPDSTLMTWHDEEGVKVAGVPDLAAGTDSCTLTEPIRLISPTGLAPSFGGADVVGAPSAAGKRLRVTSASRVTPAALVKGLTVRVTVPAAGRVSAQIRLPARIAQRLRLRQTTIASATANAAGPGRLSLRLRTTAPAKRAARRLRSVTLTIRVRFGSTTTTTTTRIS